MPPFRRIRRFAERTAVSCLEEDFEDKDYGT